MVALLVVVVVVVVAAHLPLIDCSSRQFGSPFVTSYNDAVMMTKVRLDEDDGEKLGRM